MTSKKSRTASTRIKTSNKSFIAGNNVNKSDYNTEVLNYQKEIKDLKKEITDYKNKVMSLEIEIDVLRNQSSNSVKFNLMGKNPLDQQNGRASPSSENKIKGCRCKGNCSNKICGCVKKNIICQNFCSCNNVQCKNQELQKENISVEQEQLQLSKDGKIALDKLENLSLNQEALHASKKKAKKKRSIFKSHENDNEIIEQGQIYPTNSKTIETKRKLFTQNSKELVDIDADQNNVLATNSDNLSEFAVQDPHTPISKRIRNGKNYNKDSNATISNNKQIIKKNQNIIQVPENLQENMNTKNNEKFQISESVITTNRKISGQEEIYSSEQNKDTNSTYLLRKKSMSVSPDSCRKYKNTKVKSKSVSPDKKNINDHKNNDKKLSTLNDLHYSQSLREQIQPDLDYKIDDGENNEKIQENINILSQKNLSVILQLDANENKANVNSEREILNTSLNPMMPKHELQRSPINVAGTTTMPILNKRFSSPKKELTVAEINWEQHQSELILCKICKRKFFPHRIDKHLTSCKGI